MKGSRAAVLLAVVGGIAAVVWFGLDEYFSVAAIKRERMGLAVLWHSRPAATAAAFAALNIVALALSLPGAVLGFGLAAGAIFGAWWGTGIAIAAIVLGDSLAFLVARYVLRDWVEQRFARSARRVAAGVARDGAFYLLALRLMTIMPYFVVNLTMGLTRMPLRLFAPVSFAGLLPVTFLYVQAGTQLSVIERVGEIYSPRLLVTFAALALLPLAARYALRRWQSAKPI
ncbi:MAG: VTT domain-containing protein [Sphingomicrobium sp.]